MSLKTVARDQKSGQFQLILDIQRPDMYVRFDSNLGGVLTIGEIGERYYSLHTPHLIF